MTSSPTAAMTLFTALQTPAGVDTIIGNNLANNPDISPQLVQVLRRPVVQAFLAAARDSEDPLSFLLATLVDAGVDVNELIARYTAQMAAPPTMVRRWGPHLLPRACRPERKRMRACRPAAMPFAEPFSEM